ncbi:LysR substrate-binding domain-containing protein [Planktotalea sp.]|uniref:LysR substrate-binding domain-containing protein n=1 Tax=Planktotalea sp. TaxID=2029877 RepID=UPI003296F665
MNWNTFPPLAALRAFAAYTEQGGVQQAGDVLNVSHAAISQQIRNLEDHLNVQLLDRSGRQARLTEEGRALGAVLQSGFGAIADEVEKLTGAQDAKPLTVSTTPSFAANWLVPRLADFRQQHPEISVVVDADPKTATLDAAGPDIAIRFGSGDWEGVDVRPFIETRRVAVAAPSFICDDCPTEPSDLARFPILQEVGTSESSLWLAKHGVEEAGQGGRVILPGNLSLDAARMGQGILVTAKIWVKSDLEHGRLAQIFEDEEDFGYFIVVRQGVHRTALKAFLTWLKTQT